jgi:hypothetical protein
MPRGDDRMSAEATSSLPYAARNNRLKPGWRLAQWWRSGSLTAAIAMAARASSQLALLLVTLVATRSLSPADFGVFAIAAAFLTLSRTMLYTGPFEYVLKARAEDAPAVASAGLAANGVVALGWCIGLCLFGLAAPCLFRGSGVGLLLFALAPSNFLAAVAGWEEAMVLRGQAVRRYYAITVATELVAALAAILLLVAGWGLWALVVQVYVRLAIFALAYRMVLVLPPLPAPTRAQTIAILSWSRSRYASIFVGFLANYSGDLLLGAVFSPAASGLYRAGNRVVSALADMFVQPAGLLATTSLAAIRARGGDGTGTNAPWLRAAGLFGALCWPALAGLAVVSDWIAPLLLGPAWAGAGPIIAVFCIARLAALPIAVASAVLVVADRQDRVFWVQAAAALATAGGTLLLAERGPVAAAIATAGVALGWAGALAWYAWRVQPASGAEARGVAWLVLLPSIVTPLAALLARAILSSLPVSSFGGLAITVAAGALAWLLALVVQGKALRAAVAAVGH